ncbi:RING finger protein 207-like [Ostrea edulis]|uniref:RING finger protein 207-like n=1 Tax=Ostrea edulis TaxID=37623 RepID=UPI0024AECCBC|nr:RING finger protein 207-like [Ostrea edulis]XP_048747695.2 RING finger protein 207-like [Ostrea edulis]XP_056000116.1 RING finger protein 207-like [Ostrea edulis]
MKMSGDIFQSLENNTSIDVTKWNPLQCYLCNEKYDDPCILSCYHSYCSQCLRGRAADSKLSCPLCGCVTSLKDSESLPSPDHLMKFLVDQSSQEDLEPCANCDEVSSEMFFCNTCSQALCLPCRTETHKAKMFVSHDVINLSSRTKEVHRECLIHREPYILFSTEKKTMLCINCFRDMKIESRSHCMDMETAYAQGCKKLDQTMQAIRELQNSARDTIFLLKALLSEIQQSSEDEKKAITDLYNLMMEKITEMKTDLLKEVDRQYQEKEKVFKKELSTLSTLLPTLHTHLVTCSAFTSSANRFEFLDLAYILMDRLKSIINQQHPLHPSQSGQICTDYKVQYSKCLEPLLFPSRTPSQLCNVSTKPGPISSIPSSLSMTTTITTCTMNSRQHFSGGSVQFGRRGYTLPKISFTDIKSTFAEHCGEFEASHKLLCQRIDKLKFNVQELQRDLTLRRCLVKASAMEDLQEEIAELQKDLDDLFLLTEKKQPTLEKHWEDVLKKMASEQEVYKGQLSDVLRLKQETGHMTAILTQLHSFVKSIASVTERLAPKLTQSSKESDHDSNIAAIFEEINTMQPDSQHRVDAIRIAEEERETLTAVNRVNPLDEELIKTKGMLKAPSARKESSSRRNSTKRESGEFKESLSVDSSPMRESLPGDQSAANVEAQEMATANMDDEESFEDLGNPDNVKRNLEQVKLNDFRSTEMNESQCDIDVSKMKDCPVENESQCDIDVSKMKDCPVENESQCDIDVSKMKDCPVENESHCNTDVSKMKDCPVENESHCNTDVSKIKDYPVENESHCNTDVSKIKDYPVENEPQCGTGLSKMKDYPDENESHCDTTVSKIKDYSDENESQSNTGMSKI